MALETHDGNDVPGQQPVQLYIPDTMTNWLWTRSINPLEDEVTAESIAWVSQFPYFTHRGWDYTNVLLEINCGAQRIMFPCYLSSSMVIGLYAALMYPTAPRG